MSFPQVREQATRLPGCLPGCQAGLTQVTGMQESCQGRGIASEAGGSILGLRAKEAIVAVKISKRKQGNRTIMVVGEAETRKLRAENRRDYEKRIERNKNARANLSHGPPGSF